MRKKALEHTSVVLWWLDFSPETALRFFLRTAHEHRHQCSSQDKLLREIFSNTSTCLLLGRKFVFLSLCICCERMMTTFKKKITSPELASIEKKHYSNSDLLSLQATFSHHCLVAQKINFHWSKKKRGQQFLR